MVLQRAMWRVEGSTGNGMSTSRLHCSLLVIARAHVAPSPIELFVHLHIVTIVITAQLSDDGSVCQGDQFGVDFVDSGSGLVSEERQITISTTIWHSSIG